MSFPEVVSQTESQPAHERLLAKSPPYEWRRRHDEYDFLADHAGVPGARR